KHVPVRPIPPRSAGAAGMLVGDGARRRRLRGRSADGPALAVGPGSAPFGERHAWGDHSAAPAVLRERPALRPVEPVSIAGGEHIARHALELDQHALERDAPVESAERLPGARRWSPTRGGIRSTAVRSRAALRRVRFPAWASGSWRRPRAVAAGAGVRGLPRRLLDPPQLALSAAILSALRSERARPSPE